MTEVLLEIRVFLDQLAALDLKANQELGLLGHQVFKVSEARQDHQGLKELVALMDCLEVKVILVKEESEVSKVMLVYLVWMDRLEKKARKDQWELLDKMGSKEQEVRLGLLDSEDLLDLLEMLEILELLGFKDHQGSQEIQDGLVPKVKLEIQEESSTQLAPLLLESQDHPDLLVRRALLDLQDYQVPLVLLVCLANLVLKVTEAIRATREKQE